jgi:hypothetical protein
MLQWSNGTPNVNEEGRVYDTVANTLEHNQVRNEIVSYTGGGSSF